MFWRAWVWAQVGIVKSCEREVPLLLSNLQSILRRRRSARRTPSGTSTLCPGFASSIHRIRAYRRSKGPHRSSPEIMSHVVD